MPAPVIASSTSAVSSGATNTLTLTVPSGLAENDLALCIVGSDDSNGSTIAWQAESGWSIAIQGGDGVSDCEFCVYYKIAGASESAVTFDHLSNDELAGWYLRVTGIDTTTPIDVTGAVYIDGSGTSKAITGVTTTVDDCLAFYVLSSDGEDCAPFGQPTGWTEFGELTNGSGGGGVGLVFGTKTQAIAGATGTATVSTTANDGVAGVQFAIRPAASVGATSFTFKRKPLLALIGR